MAGAIAESSETPAKNEKPVIVRVKRKASHSPLEAFWLEINERPVKRPLLDFSKLSLNNSSSKVEELKKKKVLVQHVDTVSSSEVTVDILHSVVVSKPRSSIAVESKGKRGERKRTSKAVNSLQKQEKLLVKAKEKQQVLSKNARFEQIWRSRKEKKESVLGEPLREMCHLYDVVRIDIEETNIAVQARKDVDLEDHRIMSSFLPLLREFIPSAAEEIESEISNYPFEQVSEDEYVYDLYAVRADGTSVMENDSSNPFPLVQVNDDDEYYDGPEASEYESDDSNAEENPLNDYPDEEVSEKDEEIESETSNAESEHESATTSYESSENEDFRFNHRSRVAEPLYEDDIYDEDGRETYDSDHGEMIVMTRDDCPIGN